MDETILIDQAAALKQKDDAMNSDEEDLENEVEEDGYIEDLWKALIPKA
jgi:hypothetical protein